MTEIEGIKLPYILFGKEIKKSNFHLKHYIIALISYKKINNLILFQSSDR